MPPGCEVALAGVGLAIAAGAALWPALGETGFYRAGGLELSNYNDAFARQAAPYRRALLADVAARRRLEPPGRPTCREAAALTTPRAR